MVFPHTLGILHAAIHSRCVVLRETHHSLEKDEDVEDEPEDGVWGFKVRVPWTLLVDFDYDEAGEEGRDAEEVEQEMGGCAGTFLPGRVGWLED
jgi:hypothetical protein